MKKKTITNEAFANYVDNLYASTNGKYPGLIEISEHFRTEKNYNVFNVFKSGLAHKIFGRKITNMINEARSSLEDEIEPDSCLHDLVKIPV